MSMRGKKNVKVVVLGDIGRSPRMQYHSLSLAEKGHQVDIIGYGETEPMSEIKLHPGIMHHYLAPVPQISIKLVNYVFKAIFQAFNLLFLLFVTTKSNVLIVQNPPAIPALMVCWFYAKIVGAKMIIDWHNYAHTLMAIGAQHPLVKISESMEYYMGRKADSNFCVTKAMQEDLKRRHNIEAVTLYDRPPTRFKSISLEEKHEFLVKLSEQYKIFTEGCSAEGETAITSMTETGAQFKSSRPGIIVSSTSWTADEDFSVLLKALKGYQGHIKGGNSRNLPKLICIITGKGPQKEYYLNLIAEMDFSNVSIVTPWLEPEEYPKILAIADLGVSLHTSSSGLDLPMKVVDMFGCGLPVCAYSFKSLPELVKHGENGYVFRTENELSLQIMGWFENFPRNEAQNQTVENFKTQLKTFQDLRWRENWDLVAARYFE